jgi:hypothetical protein
VWHLDGVWIYERIYGTLKQLVTTLHRPLYDTLCLPFSFIFDCHLSSSLSQSQSQSHVATDGQSVSKSWCRAPSGAHDLIIITVWLLRSSFCGAPTLTRGRVCLLYMLLALASPLGLATIFYCLRFETSLFVASYEATSISTRVSSLSCMRSSLYSFWAAPTENTSSWRFLCCYRVVFILPLHKNGSILLLSACSLSRESIYRIVAQK